jgi:hypothetical protein
MQNKRNISLLILLCLVSSAANADWPIGKGRMILTPSYAYASASRMFDANGGIVAVPNSGKFTINTLSLYGAAGLSRKTDVIFNIPMASIASSSIFAKDKKSGVGDIFVGMAFHFPVKELTSYFTLKTAIILPVYSNVTMPYLGYASKGAFVGASYSFNVQKKAYAIVEGVYTRYFDDLEGPNQYNLNLIYGVELGGSNNLSFSFNHITSVSDNKTVSSNLIINKDFMYGSLSASFGKKISRTLLPTVKTFYSVYGRNAGQGLGVAAILSIKIP